MQRFQLLTLGLAMALAIGASNATAQSSGTSSPRATAPPTKAPMARQTAVKRPVVFRHENVDLAWQAAQKTGRPVLVFVTSANCYYCKKMVAETLSHPQIARATNQRYETALLSNETQPELVEKLGIKAFPTTLIVNTDGSTLASVLGFVEPAKFAAQVLPVPPARHAAARQAPRPTGNVEKR